MEDAYKWARFAKDPMQMVDVLTAIQVTFSALEVVQLDLQTKIRTVKNQQTEFVSNATTVSIWTQIKNVLRQTLSVKLIIILQELVFPAIQVTLFLKGVAKLPQEAHQASQIVLKQTPTQFVQLAFLAIFWLPLRIARRSVISAKLIAIQQDYVLRVSRDILYLLMVFA